MCCPITCIQLTSKSSNDSKSSSDEEEPANEEASGDGISVEDDCDEQTSPQSSLQASPLTTSDEVKT